MNEVEQAQSELVEEFQFFDNWMDRYQYIIDLGRRLPEFPDEQRIEKNKIKGCQSQVWFVAGENDGRLEFRAISDAAIVSGLIALLIQVYSGCSAQQIVDTEPYFIEEIGLSDHLSPTRANGLHAMLGAIKGHARGLL